MTPDLRLDYATGRAELLTDNGAKFYKSFSGLQVTLTPGQYAAALSPAALDRLHLAALAARLCVSIPAPSRG